MAGPDGMKPQEIITDLEKGFGSTIFWRLYEEQTESGVTDVITDINNAKQAFLEIAEMAGRVESPTPAFLAGRTGHDQELFKDGDGKEGRRVSQYYSELGQKFLKYEISGSRYAFGNYVQNFKEDVANALEKSAREERIQRIPTSSKDITLEPSLMAQELTNVDTPLLNLEIDEEQAKKAALLTQTNDYLGALRSQEQGAYAGYVRDNFGQLLRDEYANSLITDVMARISPYIGDKNNEQDLDELQDTKLVAIITAARQVGINDLDIETISEEEIDRIVANAPTVEVTADHTASAGTGYAEVTTTKEALFESGGIVKRGMKGGVVTECQECIEKLGSGDLLGSTGADGKFGPNTENATHAVQEKLGIPVGAWGVETEAGVRIELAKLALAEAINPEATEEAKEAARLAIAEADAAYQRLKTDGNDHAAALAGLTDEFNDLQAMTNAEAETAIAFTGNLEHFEFKAASTAAVEKNETRISGPS